jgi:hypothetical protein
MDKKLKAKWVKALMSGEFQQTTGVLNDQHGHCCLGVLHRVVTGRDPHRYWDGDKPAVVRRLELEMGGLEALTSVNDAGVPFEMIAGLIDETL